MGRLNPYRTIILPIRQAIAGSVRHKLLGLVLAPLLLGVPALLLIVWVWGTTGYNRLMVNKVSADLGAAHEFFDQVQGRLSGQLRSFGESHRLILALDSDDSERIQRVLQDTAHAYGLDYLLLLDTTGHVVSGLPAPPRSDRSQWPVVHAALGGKTLHGLAVFSPEDLNALSPELGRRAQMDMIDTRLGRKTERTTEGRGLMITAGVPIKDDSGAVRAVLEGGMLLNGNHDLIDRLNALVYQEASLPAGSEGSATIFLDDTRIATTLRLSDGRRALGTRVSQAVYEKVMTGGQPWMDLAQVLDRNFISGYTPLADVTGQRIGMLYVGFLETPLRDALTRALAGIFLAFLLVSALGSLASIRWARTIFLPLERMSRVIERVNREDDTARVGETGSSDELGKLAAAFDHLLDSLTARREELRRWAEQLDRKVAERTAALETLNQTLQQAQHQLVMTEKLSAIGELTAGVAHEINNPVAVMQGNLDLIKEILGPDQAPVEQEIRLIDEQISRIQVIVNKLLQFARPGDFAGYAEDTDINETLSDCLLLTRHNLRRSGIEVSTVLQAIQSVEMNRVELQQILINLMVNALQAMPSGGTLTLETRDIAPDDAMPYGVDRFDGVVVTIRDTGQGIQPGDLGRIFDPFFTTKKQKGTGLGLSISYAIVQRYGGRITVDSRPDEGTVFTLWLRRTAHFSDQASAPVFSSRFLD